ncbi:MAG: RNA-binding protein [Kiritimatiellaeota bacterium]|nr:RNA-binding protein [Kiritimatiellota bacterium]
MQYLIADCFFQKFNVHTVCAACGVVGLALGFVAGRLSKRGGGAAARRPKAPARVTGMGDGSCVEIYVGNLSYDMTEAQMRKEFERYGAVKSARIISNRFNNKSKGYGFIEMPNRPEAEAAIKALHDKDIYGRKLRVNEAKNKSHD